MITWYLHMGHLCKNLFRAAKRRQVQDVLLWDLTVSKLPAKFQNDSV